jgi:hypothetical protein
MSLWGKVIEITWYGLPTCWPITFVLCVFQCRLHSLAADSSWLTVVDDPELILLLHGLSFLGCNILCSCNFFSSRERTLILRVSILLLICADLLCLYFAPRWGQACLWIGTLMMLFWLCHKGRVICGLRYDFRLWQFRQILIDLPACSMSSSWQIIVNWRLYR